MPDAGLRRLLRAGVLAGLVAGAVMAAAMMAYFALTGRSVWTNPNLISAMWLGPSAADGQFGGRTLLGLLTHMVTSGLMGLVAVPFIAGLPRWRTVLVALAYAIASYPVVFSTVLTWANPLMIERSELVPMTCGHALFGLVLGFSFEFFLGRAHRPAQDDLGTAS